MHAELVMIGTELLLGEIVDTNATKLAQLLRGIGLDLYYKTTVGDNEQRIVDVLNLALDRSDVVLTSGGLGPTVDDITRQAVATATGRKLVHSSELEAQIAARFRSFGKEMTDNNKRQAYIPEDALPLPNPVGTAPCFLSEDVKGRGCIISLPGVPRELEYMMQNSVIPVLIERTGGIKVMKVRVLCTCAIGESNIDRAIGDLMMAQNPTVGLAAHAGQTDIRLTAKADTEAEAEALIAPLEAQLRERLGVAIYGVGKETVAEVTGRILAEKELKLGVVDTLTTGQLSHEFEEVGFGDLIDPNLHTLSVAEAATNLDPMLKLESMAEADIAAVLAKAAAPPDGVGLAIVGPFGQNQMTYIAVHGPGDMRVNEVGRNFKDTDYVRRWLVIQGLDWVRRATLGQLSSPVDWN